MAVCEEGYVSFPPFSLGGEGLYCVGLADNGFRLALESLGWRGGEEDAERSPEGVMVWSFEGGNWGVGGLGVGKE